MPITDGLFARLLQNRRFVRAPIAAYRHGFGWLFGSRMLLLEHTGRKSGLPRYVCLEVVERPAADRIVIVSGFGEKAQWYQNLRRHPDCHVSIGGRRDIPARARMMSDDESGAALQDYQRAHPQAWKRLRGAIEAAVGASVDTLPMVELTLRS
ncbi:nitroreductase family deazaflavin-dependent oxidoreductase [Gordonia sp. X0973]|uniref:nitroreductase family deazaflavin-dependent oxidoreductase n=1 Tax=Gordonia sp. X0973 TaxID=2742602 RepID=UPI000F529C1E|nr:nitroreductase family deazaflavin-dependent oxidoreductase [Gordonia sp. X0973]QKT08856.1 nitroreductase family deazaflavin-dependent oxidoreductase [Gordonia sp. X0973]